MLHNKRREGGGGALGPIRDRKIGQNFHQNQKTGIMKTEKQNAQNRKTTEDNDPKQCGPRACQANTKPKNCFIIKEKRKPNIKLRDSKASTECNFEVGEN